MITNFTKKIIMDMYTLQDGDDLERHYLDEIRSKVDAYELIWSNFIGNNGMNQMAPLKNLPKEKENFRKHFSEHHYTIIQSILCLRVIKDDIFLFDLARNDPSIRLQNLIIGFYAHMGRIFDNLIQLFYHFGRISDIIEKDIELDEIIQDRFVRPQVKSLEEFYYQRHIVVHGKQVPIGFDKLGNIIFPKLRIEKNSPSGYDKHMLWTEATEWAALKDSISEIETDLPSCINNILHSLYKRIKEYLKNNNIEIELVSLNAEKKPIDVYNLQGKNLCQPDRFTGYSGSVNPLKK